MNVRSLVVLGRRLIFLAIILIQLIWKSRNTYLSVEKLVKVLLVKFCTNTYLIKLVNPLGGKSSAENKAFLAHGTQNFEDVFAAEFDLEVGEQKNIKLVNVLFVVTFQGRSYPEARAWRRLQLKIVANLLGPPTLLQLNHRLKH